MQRNDYLGDLWVTNVLSRMETISKATGVEQGAGLANTDASWTPRQTRASGHRSFIDSLRIYLNIHCEKARARIYSRKGEGWKFWGGTGAQALR
jgi:hypothetical protein